ncbi:DNA repair protein [Terrimonas sp.]|uniref:JAB domain-containing protein n=1 Tax=Terrimonas sp. TaxID=1914338 RepID=UPI000D518ADB|nr:JAB domain-containing protein [Terrimonas sp.]PVD49394.1 DNA repair protein [Terrimonas sp.]
MNIRLKKQEQVKVMNTSDLYTIMQRILLRENKIDRNREHFWTVSLDTACKILNIELISLGSVNKVLVEPMEVFSVPLQKRAVSVVLVHNHPSGELVPSVADKDITDRLIQCGQILNVSISDHLIITEKTYYSSMESGLLQKLRQSKKYVPEYKLKELLTKEMEASIRKDENEQKAKAMAKVMKQNGEAVEKIMQYTGLSKTVIQRIKI